jgi:Ribonuclease HI
VLQTDSYKPWITEAMIKKMEERRIAKNHKCQRVNLETIHTRCPEDQWLHVYTEGPLQNPEEEAGITCKLFSFYKSMGKNTTHFDGEITAIKIAIQQLTYRIHHLKKVVILSDSTSAIQAIGNTNITQSKQIQETRNMIKHLHSLNKLIVLQWIPSHCGLYGNETADTLAKKGTKSKLNQ